LSNYLAGIIGSLLAGLATAIGGIPVLFSKVYSRKTLDTMLGFSAGVMLVATAFSLLVPTIRIGGIWKTSLGVVMGNEKNATFGVILGFLVMMILDNIFG